MMNLTQNAGIRIAGIISTILSVYLLSALNVFAQSQPSEIRALPPNQIIEREMTGAETHRYKFDLKANEFFQVRVEQKGVDVALKLLDANGKILATMDSPNGKEGPETLSFIAEKASGFILEIGGFDAKAEKGIYIIKREASRDAAANDKQRVAIEKLFVEGVAARNTTGQGETAIKKLEEALKGWQELEINYLIDLTEKQIKAIKIKRRTDALIAEFLAPQQLLIEGQKLLNKGNTESLLAARTKLAEAVESSRKFFKRLDDENLSDLLNKEVRGDWKLLIKSNEVNALNGIASTYAFLKDWEESISYNKLAIAVIQEMRQNPEIRASKYFTSMPFPLKVTEASTIGSIATALKNLNKLQDGIVYSNQALILWREVQQESEKMRSNAKFQEYLLLFEMGQIYRSINDRRRGLELFEQSLEIIRNIPNQRSQEALTLMEIGNVYDSELNYGQGLEYQKGALKIYEEIDDKPSQALILELIGLSYLNLNNEQKASEYFNQTLKILLLDNYLEYFEKRKTSIPFPSEFKTEDPNIFYFYKDIYEWQRYSSIGNIYGVLGEKEKQLEYLEKSLVFARLAKNQNMIRLSLIFIGNDYADKKDWQKALDYYKQSLEISRQLSDKEDLARDLSNIAYLYFDMKSWQNALQAANEALLIYQSLGADKNSIFTGYSTVLNIIARVQNELGNRRLAIFYGKQAVNAIQRERQQLQNLDLESQRGYLKRNEKPYRRLADWLIEQGNFAQAEKVLAMLKEEEYFDFVRRDQSEIEKLSERVPLSDKEKALIARYSLLADKITEIGQEFIRLDDKKRQLSRSDLTLSADEQKHYAELEKQLDDANAAFQLFLTKELVAEIGKEKAGEIEIDRNLQDKLRKWGEGTVALYTVAGEDRYRVILTTPKVQIDGKTEIKIADLNKKVFAFRAALQNPKIDPRPLGKELYDILIKPVEKELKAANAKTLVWSLDGSLRYVPLAALSPDGKRYLVEDFQNVIITPKTRDDLSVSSSDWQALGLGVSEAQTVESPEDKTRQIPFNPLPGTERELLAIVRDEKSAGETGVLAGRRFMNKDFTTANFKDSLIKETGDGRRKYNVIHIASHFRLGSNDSNSFILLGNGNILTLEEIRNSSTIDFGNIELVTLSACNTAFADETNGGEIDSLASVIQTKSGKAVLATLWAVADESTELLMSEFYRLRKENPKLTKAEAMQRAQIEMINGKIKSAGKPNGCRAESVGADGKQTKFNCDANAPFAHPFYWSPFVLIGNWK